MDLPTDTVAQSVERRRDKSKVWVPIQMNVRIFICSVAFFPLLLLLARLINRQDVVFDE